MKPQPSKPSVTPTKAAVVAVLSVALVWVWAPMLIGSGGAGREGADAYPSELAVASLTEGGPAGPRSEPRPDRPATSIGLAEALACDPFAPSDWSPAAHPRPPREPTSALTADDAEARFDALRQTGVAMILVSGAGRAAQVGDRTVRVGDQIDGFEVVEITDEGVVLRPSASEPEGGRGA